MDPAEPVRLTARRTGSDWIQRLAIVLPATMLAVLLLVALKLLADVPKALLGSLGGLFVLTAATFALVRRQTASRTRHIGELTATWLLTGLALLAFIHLLDRAGWIWLSVTGYERLVDEAFERPENTTVADFLADNHLFARDPELANGVFLEPGIHAVERTIIVPPGLVVRIAPGAELRFWPGRSWISYSPVLAKGTREAPIRVTAQYIPLKWGVIAIIDAPGSVFEHAYIEHGRHAKVNGTEIPGALSFIRSDARIIETVIQDAYGKDAVNVQHSHVMVIDSVFRNAYKDCLDLDDATGLISRNRFTDCGDEGIDLGGSSTAQVFDNTVLDVRGGRIAADQGLEEILRQNSFGYSDRGR